MPKGYLKEIKICVINLICYLLFLFNEKMHKRYSPNELFIINMFNVSACNAEYKKNEFSMGIKKKCFKMLLINLQEKIKYRH